ncbi:bifunctional 4-hydroxy-2-oxoglutarate aldolase/2-dehydro-3-deoxy-phosphogluconate aldolase [Bacillus sp. CMF21]|uniref:bifunctional 4-hydroxy-2-oxoglutarate aldolase/2-dehydro-3-deoxy-phosphogluconate aldolase n=1 Tax=Metabacillus dongyingensis TaxID=2874282 RepID=UPI001CBD1C47|nr:bifunctional 4-hydroxy-2-oxoglutarate aldolase/2-dehydro-3-deoxy-phosphogluconate aldolase [Metabacillus dongyingensis]UAL50633.1 bifunctional 4-hydroxy-2-oxoglutarate aldolase/2-dehydro-3-deoxy-phosphogluconate aldolase [Metabacillus dongyingensis]USK26900.1 bifunctional 4-hydroxy-2-oxoglutarate aldolase/2-dehydro-3-deoxy-phosphogluconate aldolase [Bacillus sp. CMF21]
MGVTEIRNRGVVAVIRGATPESIISIGNALKDGGVTALEITMETPRAASVIEAAAAYFGAEVLVGAGTVLDPETARVAILSGAKFIFSPTVRKETITMAKRYGVISVPGAFTPTEILTAYEYGADLIKVFPADAFGPSYLKNIAGPLPHIPLMPTGGVDLHNTADYMKAGAVAVGVGSTLVNTKKPLTEEALFNMKEKAADFINEVKKAREEIQMTARF